MKLRIFAGAAVVVLTGCAATPRGEDPVAGELRAAQYDDEMDQRALHAMEDQNRLLAAELAAERATAVERAELSRRVDELARANEKLTDAVAKIQHGDDPKAEHVHAAASATTPPIGDPTDVELNRLRAKLAESGSGPVTLTPAQVRALLRALRAPRPIDPESPFAM